MSKTNKGNKGPEVLEDPNALVDKFKDSELFFEKNKKVFTYILAALAVAIGAFAFYKYQNNQNNENAQADMFNAVFAWEKDSLKTALEGDKFPNLNQVLEDYPNTDAGNLANYYVGVALLKQGKFEESIEKLKDFNSNDLLLQGWTYSLIGDAYLELKDVENAIEYYNKAASYNPNEGFTPKYLMKLGLAYEVNKDYESAAKAYNKIIEEYPMAANINDAKKYKGQAESLMGRPADKK